MTVKVYITNNENNVLDNENQVREVLHTAGMNVIQLAEKEYNTVIPFFKETVGYAQEFHLEFSCTVTLNVETNKTDVLLEPRIVYKEEHNNDPFEIAQRMVLENLVHRAISQNS